MSNIKVIGIDVAKNSLQIYGDNGFGKQLLNKRVSRKNFLSFMATVPKVLIGMEACGRAHFLGRELTKLGFGVKLMNPRKVKAFVQNHKNDVNDAAACATAALREDVRSIPIKTHEQTQLQLLHRHRSKNIGIRTQILNVMRSTLSELGVDVAQGKQKLVEKVYEILEEHNPLELMEALLDELRESLEVLKQLNESICRQDSQLKRLAQADEHCKKLLSIPGVGPITATAIVCKIGNGSHFEKGRELSAYLGLVPKQHSSGERTSLSKITKHGDRYLRCMLIHGGRSCVAAALLLDKKTGEYKNDDEHYRWIRSVHDRAGFNKTAVAVANKNARMIVSILKNEGGYRSECAH